MVKLYNQYPKIRLKITSEQGVHSNVSLFYSTFKNGRY